MRGQNIKTRSRCSSYWNGFQKWKIVIFLSMLDYNCLVLPLVQHFYMFAIFQFSKGKFFYGKDWYHMNYPSFTPWGKTRFFTENPYLKASYFRQITYHSKYLECVFYIVPLSLIPLSLIPILGMLLSIIYNLIYIKEFL